MRELELLEQFLMQLRQEKLQRAHAVAVDPDGSLLDIRVAAYQAELCSRIMTAVRVLGKDPGQFIKDHLQ